MEMNNCKIKHLDSDALLPPRKRLLAGLRRQSCDFNCSAPSISHIVDTRYDTHLNNLLKATIDNPDLPNDEIVETSRLAAAEATEIAVAARAKAEIKAAKAARAMAAARNALDLMATLSEEAAEREKSESKMKKHITVETMYSQDDGNINSRKDGELARKLHQAVNISLRILRYTSGSDAKNQKHKKLKTSASCSVRGAIQTAVLPEERNDFSTGKEGPKKNSEALVKETDMVVVDMNEHAQHGITDHPRSKYKESEVPSADKSIVSLDISSKKSGRMKQKKLPLNICNFKDQTNSKGDQCLQATPQSKEDNSVLEASIATDKPVKSVLTIDGTSAWKCQAFRAPNCVTQNKVMQS